MRQKISIIMVILLIVLSFGNKVEARESQSSSIEIDDYLEEALGKTHVPGMSLAVTDGEKITYSKVYGEVKSIDTPFIIGSMSKSFTALAVMQLVEEGKVDLDDKIVDLLPEAIGNFKGSNQITVRQLLNQTSGIASNAMQPHLEVTSESRTFEYANENYNLLGSIVEAVTHMNFETYIQENIFNVLGMSHSFTSLNIAREKGLVSGYQTYFGIPMAKEVSYIRTHIPSGYIISSASDLAIYLNMYLNEGKVDDKKLISTESLQKMMYVGVDMGNDPAAGDMFAGKANYGMGWIHKEINHEILVYHSGKVENYVSTMVLLPKQNMGVVMLFNMQDFLVAQPMIEAIQEGVVSIILGNEPRFIDKEEYIKGHILINTIELLIVISAIIPLLGLKKWQKKYIPKSVIRCALKQEQNSLTKCKPKRECKDKKVRTIIVFMIGHVIWPSLLLLVFPSLGIPLSLVKGFLPDVFIILIGSAILLYLVGIYKFYKFIWD